jgi:putative hydrolase of the HAD superfamily
LLFTEDEEVEQFKAFYNIIAAELPELGITEEQADEMGEFKVFDTSNFIFFDKSRETLLKLKEKYKLGIISDTWPSADRILRSGNVEDLFDCKTYSCHLGTWKPDKRMYLHALEQMGLPPEQTVFVDDWENNLDGAAECGIRPVLIKARANTPIPGQRFSEVSTDSGKYPGINTIGELPGLLEEIENSGNSPQHPGELTG